MQKANRLRNWQIVVENFIKWEHGYDIFLLGEESQRTAGRVEKSTRPAQVMGKGEEFGLGVQDRGSAVHGNEGNSQFGFHVLNFTDLVHA